jgi:hypothetical protein
VVELQSVLDIWTIAYSSDEPLDCFSVAEPEISALSLA